MTNPTSRPSGASTEPPRCQYVFAGTTNKCGAVPDHLVHLFGQWQEWPGPEEYHGFVRAGAASTEATCDAMDGSVRCGRHLERGECSIHGRAAWPNPDACCYRNAFEDDAHSRTCPSWADAASTKAMPRTAIERMRQNIAALRRDDDRDHYLRERFRQDVAAIRASTEATERPNLRAALELIDRNGCQNFTRGRCWEHGRQRGARYGADAWCDACIARAALTGATSPPPAEATERPDLRVALAALSLARSMILLGEPMSENASRVFEEAFALTGASPSEPSREE